eukprot:TRINITY_DN51100_c0_g1_i1.p1 TRINITY_DN51100_c0_g1~~TRINITY_DN51100_c0_g1_i1.p1  ORF type:complete len:681 (+),score=115.52 TRINITY_DN51100_c0_g1_i1:58-2100(+)
MVKKALCIGLNYPGQKYQLYGCTNDALNWEHMLKNTLHFDETRVLIDQHPDGELSTAPTQIPTYDNVLAQLGWLCQTAEHGDCLMLVFAGHGCQVRDSAGEINQALVPADYNPAVADDHKLVMDDELHALFSCLPAGTFLTVVLDCCHSTGMLDVPCSVDSSQKMMKMRTSCERPLEVPHRTMQAWEKMLIPHALARPRFLPTVVTRGPTRRRRTQPGAGSHAGNMTLNPAVTAFCFSACRSDQTSLDASIKAHQQGLLSFCLLEALAQLKHRCTYEQLFEKACAKLEDIRDKYMPMMDQYMQMSFCPNSAPSEVVFVDPRYATVAQHRVYQRAKSGDHGQPYRDNSMEFVPSPMYGQQNQQAPASDVGSQMARPVAYVYARLGAAHGLRGPRGGRVDAFVVGRVGRQSKQTPPVANTANPVWTRDHDFAYSIAAEDHFLEFEVRNDSASKNEMCIGRTEVDLRTLVGGQWHHQRSRLQEGAGELEFDVRIDRLPGHDVGPKLEHGEQARDGRMDMHAEGARAWSADARSCHTNGGPPMPEKDAASGAGGIFGSPNLFGIPNLFGGNWGGSGSGSQQQKQHFDSSQLPPPMPRQGAPPPTGISQQASYCGMPLRTLSMNSGRPQADGRSGGASYGSHVPPPGQVNQPSMMGSPMGGGRVMPQGFASAGGAPYPQGMRPMI